MRAILCAYLLFASCGVAADQTDEFAAAAAIRGVIVELNQSSQTGARFTDDGNAASELERLRNAHPLGFRIMEPSATMDACPPLAILDLPCGKYRFNPTVVNQTVVNQSIVFVTRDVALAEGAFTYEENALPQSTPILFVMKKEGDDWKIASVRVLAPH